MINRRLLPSRRDLEPYKDWKISAILEDTGSYRLHAEKEDGASVADCFSYLSRVNSLRANTMEASVEDLEGNIQKARENLISLIESCSGSV